MEKKKTARRYSIQVAKLSSSQIFSPIKDTNSLTPQRHKSASIDMKLIHRMPSSYKKADEVSSQDLKEV